MSDGTQSAVCTVSVDCNVQCLEFSCFIRFGGEEQHEENRVHLGNAIMSFYAALIDLLGRCAPEMHASVCFMAYLFCFCSASDDDLIFHYQLSKSLRIALVNKLHESRVFNSHLKL